MEQPLVQLMKIEDHQRKILRMEQTLTKLANEADYETIIEVCLLVSAHYLNAAMHRLGTLRIDRDIRHNRLYGELLRNKRLREESQAVAELINTLELLRPRHVYGAGEDGKTAARARSLLQKITTICRRILEWPS